MAGFTNYAYRQIVRGFGGAGLQATEMINAKGFQYLDEHHQEFPDRLWGVKDEARPLAVQIWDNDPATLAAVGPRLAHEFRVSVVDINFGCPVRQVTVHAHSGSYLLRYPERVGGHRRAHGRGLRHAGNGQDPAGLHARLGQCHHRGQSGGSGRGRRTDRTRPHGKDFFSGSADWGQIARIKEHLRRIPLIGNGDLDSPAKVIEAFARYGVDGVMIARAALNRPWLFKQVQAALRGEPVPPDPSLEEERGLLLHHYGLVVARASARRKEQY